MHKLESTNIYLINKYLGDASCVFGIALGVR